MIRKIIKIDEEKCNGCGLCASACHEGAIGLVNGKAKLLHEHYCDGLGDCLPACPMDAISFEEREAPAYDEVAVKAAKKAKTVGAQTADQPGLLSHFPIQLMLVNENNPDFDGADLLIAADCTGFACGNLQRDFIAGRTTVIACPKLDGVNYAEKLSRIFAAHEIKSITVLRMMVPCCGGLPFMVRKAIEASGKKLPLTVVTVSAGGEVINKEEE
jgi:Fe-S-cluster-containing hydrogenase component 2